MKNITRKQVHVVLTGAVLIYLALRLFGMCDARAAQNGSKTTGVGVILGSPTGLTAKFWSASDQAIDAGLAYSFSEFMLIYGDYLFHFPGLFGSSTQFVRELKPYFGVGGAFFFSTDGSGGRKRRYSDDSTSAGLGLRVPFGAEWLPATAPLGVFLELVPGVGLAPGTTAFLDGGVGVRYYF